VVGVGVAICCYMHQKEWLEVRVVQILHTNNEVPGEDGCILSSKSLVALRRVEARQVSRWKEKREPRCC
jgi:hypothetical protein